MLFQRHERGIHAVCRAPTRPGGGAGVVSGPARALRARLSCSFIVVDPGYVVDPVDWGTPDQPHNPDPPPKPARKPGKRDKFPWPGGVAGLTTRPARSMADLAGVSSGLAM